MGVDFAPVELRLEELWDAVLGTFTGSQGLLVGGLLLILSTALVNLHDLLILLELLLLSWLMFDARRNTMQVSQLGKSKLIIKVQERRDLCGEIRRLWRDV